MIVHQKADILIIGGGAAGFFTAINAAERNPKAKIVILERGKTVLNKVRISGGGRCNVTHAEFLPKELSKNYPRGEKEILGPFHHFMTGDIMAWFEDRGVELKIEEDGRVFPASDTSETVIQCFLSETQRLGIHVLKNHPVRKIEVQGQHWQVLTKKDVFFAEKMVIASGSNPKIWNMLENLGHRIVPPVPSLFTFNCKDGRIGNLSGVVVDAGVKVMDTKLSSEGPLLITHWGMSGPAILKLSAWGANELNARNYNFDIRINWLVDESPDAILEKLKSVKISKAKQQVSNYPKFDLPKRLWRNLVAASKIPETDIWADLNKKQLLDLTRQLTQSTFLVHGKSTFKEEFVTAGGIELSEVDFKNFKSKLYKNLYFAGEVLNIDAVTGGFNFQSAWTSGFLVAKDLMK